MSFLSKLYHICRKYINKTLSSHKPTGFVFSFEYYTEHPQNLYIHPAGTIQYLKPALYSPCQLPIVIQLFLDSLHWRCNDEYSPFS
jgi:hypothetical protein